MIPVVRHLFIGKLGPNMVTDGTFDADVGWSKSNAGGTIANGVATIVSVSSCAIYKPAFLNRSRGYRVTWELVRRVSGSLNFERAGGAAAMTVTQVGPYMFCNHDAANLAWNSNNCDLDFDNVTCRMIS